MLPLVAYYRVSTQGQGRSGLGLAAQRAAVQAFAKAEGFEIAAEYTEIETGSGADALAKRPELRAALKAAKHHGLLWRSQSSIGSAVMLRSLLV